ncbi:MAG: hypothetical protein QGF20_12095 [Alphaproteobacteria bacterium]|jgi:hypothetical protein|nr:hypothetical protein [Alphaproteobacteria bacterium]
MALSEVPTVTATAILEDPDWGRMGRRLVFVDRALELEFRAAERNRNLGQARFVLWLALAIEIAFAAIDPLVLPANGMTFVLVRTVLLSLFLLLLLGLTYAPFFRTR